MNKTALICLACAMFPAHGNEILLPIEVNVPVQKDELNAVLLPSVRMSSDTASLLDMTPAISRKTGGGLSSLPVIQGMADDRIRINVDGASITSSCSNHMNPALSYIDPSKVGSIDVLAGITPVSMGGDSIGGTISVKSREAFFSGTPGELNQKLNLKTFFKHNNEGQGASARYEVASHKTYFSYAGLDERANNYRNGKGERIKSTLYNQNNQTGALGKKVGKGELSLKFTRAVVPYQGFINQYMDVQDNVSNQVTLNYEGRLGEAFVESSVYHQHVRHKMDLLSSERAGSMPMHTRSYETGYNVKLKFDSGRNSILTLGNEYNRYRLNDWWPPLPGVTSVMGPQTFESVKDGQRDRLGLFLEAESMWTNDFSTILGLRTDIVSMNAADVQGYNDTDNLPVDAAAFNNQSRQKRDKNIDATSLLNYRISSWVDFEMGLARKTRSPNLYERYAWAGSVTNPATQSGMSSMGAGMDMTMINWFGDGNGYVGDISLRPEVAHKISASLIAHDISKKEWEIRLTPHYSDVQDFIDVDFLGHSRGNNFLKFANHDAVIFGADLSIKSKLMASKNMGELNLQGIASYVRGYRKDGKADLYHLMPLNGKIALQHSYKKWTTDIITHLVGEKDQVHELRLEPTTGKYALLDVGVSYFLTEAFKIDLACTNVFNINYGLPLGGVDLVNHAPSSRTAVVGMGRAFGLSVSVDFF